MKSKLDKRKEGEEEVVSELKKLKEILLQNFCIKTRNFP